MTVIAVYWPGLYGGWLFDDYPNIVDNQGVHPQAVSVPSLVRAALSSPASEFKRPLAALSFAANYLTVGLEPFWWKLTNLVVHLLNGLLVFWLARLLLDVAGRRSEMPAARHAADTTSSRAGIVAALIAAAWMLLPINLTGVLYVVQRMESMANVFVLLGLIGYTIGRQRMLAAGRVDAGTQLQTTDGNGGPDRRDTWLARQRCFILCAISITVPAAVGLLAKETAVMLPLYALLVEWALFRFYRAGTMLAAATENTVRVQRRDLRIISLFGVVLVLPILVGLTWLVPHVLNPETWATRDFTLGTRLLSEARIVVDYIGWTVVPSPGALAFYHDDFSISTGLLAPWTTLASIVGLAALTAFAAWVRARRPLVALGIALFLGCQLLTGTILPLELIYEHRNYFASFGLMLALVPVFVAPAQEEQGTGRSAGLASHSVAAGRTGEEPAATTHPAARAELGAIALPLAVLRYALFGVLLLLWIGLTGFTAYKWGNPLRLAEELALRAPQSPRAQYELGRAYIIYSRY
ncbi:MAG: hypothetical protein ABIQ63_02490, partial [Rhodanobacter sp.]